MSSKYALSVSLTEHLCHFVDTQVASGRYRTASEVVREALRLLESQFPRPAPTAQNAVASGDANGAKAVGTNDRELQAQRRGRGL
ncbi:antitoxin ParD1/3/4 [Paraburkholderia sp. BL6669N2]|uniref:type II toxin-antitoxin system ParD family antitoxin n=1 Tax=Paraburkholderia sp. BL6669N2 TaxID=1938807 RepID=UPI000E23EAF6|nr:type II toxin-antitoxin system ParD family antitoxin [Paraburkholderia sp. BL6669N2]REG61534.1 antitoxin ParD1/3/4 [Paraburkholderia sp. BL6669N2]